MHIDSRFRTILLLTALVSLTGCLFRRTHDVTTRIRTTNLKEASLPQLVDIMNHNAASFQSLNATVDIDSSVGGQKKGKITEFREVTGYLLVRKPSMLHLIGQFPVLHNRAFDMVSTEKGFKLSIPFKEKFIIGSAEVTTPADNPLYNIRPQHILDALLLKPVDQQNDIAVLENGIEIVKDEKKQDVEQGDYVVIVLSKDEHGYFLSRKIVFNRENLQPERQLIYDRQGVLVTDARYDNLQEFSGMVFPTQVQLDRPVEEYSITLNISKLTLNTPIEDAKFELQQPAGSQLINLDDKATAQELSRPKVPPKKPKS